MCINTTKGRFTVDRSGKYFIFTKIKFGLNQPDSRILETLIIKEKKN